MDISPAHAAAVETAVRNPALAARLALLASATAARARFDFYGTAYPDPPGTDPEVDPVVTVPMTAAAGVVDEENYQLVLDTPIEGQVTGADAETGTIPLWARISGPDDAWWADVTVSVEGGTGEIQLAQTGVEGDPAEPVARLFNGAYARLTGAVIEG